MPTHVMLLVLLGALLHASWNAIVKSGGNKLGETGLIAGGGALVALLAVPFVPLPATASIPWLVTSIAIHQLYYALVAAAYRAGDMGHTYPLMRGTAPLLVALVSAPLLGETLSTHAWIGVMLICGGILLLALHRHAAPRATVMALCNALVIAIYTLIDGTGTRLSGNAVSYVLWLTLLEAFPLLTWLWLRDGKRFQRQLRQRGAIALIGGTCAIGSYGFAAMGDDASTGRDGCGIARDVGAVRGRHRNLCLARGHRSTADYRRRSRGGRRGDAAAGVTLPITTG